MKMLLIFLVFLVPVLSGCVDKTIYPEVILTVVSVTPNDVSLTISPNSIPPGTAPITLPPVVVALRSETPVPAKLKSYSITYRTRLGELIPELTVSETPFDLFLPGSTENSISLLPYSERVVNLFFRTPSDIFPLRVTMVLTIHDANHNTIQKEAHCLLLAPVTS